MQSSQKGKRLAGLCLAAALAIVLMVTGAGSASAGQTSDGLVSHWEAEGNALDSADGNDGSLVNGATATALGIIGNRAFGLDGVGVFWQR